MSYASMLEDHPGPVTLGINPVTGSPAALIAARPFADDLQVKRTFIARAVFDVSPSARRAAVQAVAAGWAQDPQTLPWLQTRGTDDPHEDVRQAAVRAIWEITRAT
jgi:hypothetical protein